MSQEQQPQNEGVSKMMMTSRTMMNQLIRRGFGLGLAGLALIWLALAARVAHAAEALVEESSNPPATAKPHTADSAPEKLESRTMLFDSGDVYPDRKDSVGVSLRAQGQDAVLKKLDAWQMNSIWN